MFISLFSIILVFDVCYSFFFSDPFKHEKDVCDKEVEVVADDGSSLVSKTMAEEEENLLKERAKEEEEQCEEAPDLNDTQFNKLDELLTQTKLYSEFLLEKMDDITFVLIYFLTLSVFLLC